MKRALCLVTLMLLALPSAIRLAKAQEPRGAIVGQVTDKTSAVIAGAAVTITNKDTGQVLKLETNATGAYSAPLLPLGTYRIEITSTGFKRFQRDGVQVGVSDRLQIDIQLEVGNATESITVTEGAPLLDAADSSIGQTIDSKRIAELPLAHGNPYALIALAPGTSFEQNAKLNRPYEVTHIVGFSMDGTRQNSNDVTLDGVANTAVTTGSGSDSTRINNYVTAAYVPPTDAVAEFKVQTAPFDAKTGQTPGGVVNISLKSGSNALHGTAYWSKRTPGMMANDYFANAAGQARSDFTYDRWGGSVNGPVLIPKLYDGRNKTFFMWSYEGLHEARPRPPGNPLAVPTKDMRGGDFSELLALGSQYQIYNPFSRRREGSRYRADPFSNNIIPSNLMDPAALKFLEYIPGPRSNGTIDHLENYPAANTPETIKYLTHVGRIDHNFGDRHRLFVRGAGNERLSTANDWFETLASGQSQNYFTRSAAADYVWTVQPTFLVNLRYGYNRYVRLTDPLRGRNLDLTTTLGFSSALNNAIDPAFREFPNYEVRAGSTTIFQTQNIGENRNIDTQSLVAAFSKASGSHNLDFGYEYRVYRYNRYFISTRQSGYYSFDETYTRGPLDNANPAPAGQGFAALLLGLPASRSLVQRNSSFAEQSTASMFYIQDSWRMTRKLTVNLGLRYELESPLTERFDRAVRGFDSTAALPQEAAARAAYAASYAANPTPELPPDQFKVRGGLQFAGVKGQPREMWDRIYTNFMPRVGFAYSPNQKTVIRGGFGMYYVPMGIRRTDISQNGYSLATSQQVTTDNLSFTARLSNPFPNGIQEPSGASLGLETELGRPAIYFLNTNPSAPYMQRWQVSIQREILPNTVVDFAYVGNRGRDIETETVNAQGNINPGKDINALPVANLSNSLVRDAANIQNNAYMTANIPNPFFGLPNMGPLSTATTVPRSRLLQPYPQFQQVITTDNLGSSSYHALQARVERRYNAGLTLNLAYAYSKFTEQVTYLNAADLLPSKAVALQDHPQRVTVSGIYELPIGRGRPFLTSASPAVNTILGGWQLQAIYTYQTGAPLSWLDTTRMGGGNVSLDTRDPNRWFDTSQFLRDSTLRPQNHLRTWPLRFSNIRGDATNNWDLSVLKKIIFKERYDIQVRAEFLNVFNHPLFNTTAGVANPINMDPYSSSFGKVTQTAAYPREVQIGLRFAF